MNWIVLLIALKITYAILERDELLWLDVENAGWQWISRWACPLKLLGICFNQVLGMVTLDVLVCFVCTILVGVIFYIVAFFIIWACPTRIWCYWHSIKTLFLKLVNQISNILIFSIFHRVIFIFILFFWLHECVLAEKYFLCMCWKPFSSTIAMMA